MNRSYLKQPICYRLGDMGWTAYVAATGNRSIVGDEPKKPVTLRRAIPPPLRESMPTSPGLRAWDCKAQAAFQ